MELQGDMTRYVRTNMEMDNRKRLQECDMLLHALYALSTTLGRDGDDE
jgi:hypothetical protein